MAMRERLIVRATDAELRHWRRQAWLAGAPSLSAFVRELLNARPAGPTFGTGKPLAAAPPERDWKAELERIAAGSPR
jgi:hypothetical protein